MSEFFDNENELRSLLKEAITPQEFAIGYQSQIKN